MVYHNNLMILLIQCIALYTLRTKIEEIKANEKIPINSTV